MYQSIAGHLKNFYQNFLLLSDCIITNRYENKVKVGNIEYTTYEESYIFAEKICVQSDASIEIVISIGEFELNIGPDSIKWIDGRIVYLLIGNVEYYYDTRGDLICLKTDDYVVVFDILADRTYEDYEIVLDIFESTCEFTLDEMKLKDENYQNILKNEGMIFYHDKDNKLNMLHILSSITFDEIILNIDIILKLPFS